LISFSHIHVIKYETDGYTKDNLGYTRIGLGDSNNNSFLFNHCIRIAAPTSCFHVLKKPNPGIIAGECYTGEIPPEEFEDREYKLDQPLLFEKSRDNRAFLTKTNSVMPNFTDNLLKWLG